MSVLSRGRFLILVVASMALAAPNPQDPAQRGRYAIRWHAGTKADPASVEVAGIDAQNLAALVRSDWDQARWSALLSVTIASEGGEPPAQPPAILGVYRVVGDVLRFAPRFAWEPGLVHRVRFRASGLPIPAGDATADLTTEFSPARPNPTAPASVVRVDPTVDRVPENLLKFYLHFSKPMSRGEVYQRVQLQDASGRKLDLPFLELGEELWDPTGMRVTLLLDPGRIKRGLKPREEQGPILESGRAYRLVVDRNWPDAEGQPLRGSYRKAFRAGPVDEIQPDPRNWTIEPPQAGDDRPLSVEFPEPLDHAMLERVLHVRDPAGKIVAGRVEVGHAGTRWSFRPDRAWGPGTFQLVADTALEDLAGNSIARPFEVDISRSITRRIEPETVAIPFQVRGDPSP